METPQIGYEDRQVPMHSVTLFLASGHTSLRVAEAWRLTTVTKRTRRTRPSGELSATNKKISEFLTTTEALALWAATEQSVERLSEVAKIVQQS